MINCSILVGRPNEKFGGTDVVVPDGVLEKFHDEHRLFWDGNKKELWWTGPVHELLPGVHKAILAETRT